MTKKYLVLDFETTGLDHKKEQVTEVAALKYDESFNQIGAFHTYVNLHVAHGLSDFIKDLTGITEEKLEQGISEKNAMAALANLIDEETIVVAQYAPFDFAYLSNYGILPSNYICTKTLTNIAEPFAKSNLGETCKRNGIDLKNAHTAIADVKATAKLLKLRLEQGYGTYQNYVTEQPDRPLNFIPVHTIEVLNTETFKKKG